MFTVQFSVKGQDSSDIQQCESVAQGLFMVGATTWIETHVQHVEKKNPGHVGIPLMGPLRHQTINLLPLNRAKTWGTPPEVKVS